MYQSEKDNIQYEKNYCGIICDKVIYGRITPNISSGSDTSINLDLTPYDFKVAPKFIFVNNKSVVEMIASGITTNSCQLIFRASPAGTYTINYVLLENPQNYIEVASGNRSISGGSTATMDFDISSYKLSDTPSNIFINYLYGATSWHISSKTRTSVSISYNAAWTSNYHQMRIGLLVN